MTARGSEPEVIARPDLEAVLADDKTKELIEEYEAEARTRTFTGWWDKIVTTLAVATTLFALYFAVAMVCAMSGHHYVSMPFLALFFVGFAYVGVLSLHQSR